jgi:peptidoglycan/LPS O-acetylase OafA/YrhL
VAFDHYFMGEINQPFRSSWSDPPEDNRRLVQLPPIRLLFAAHAMVPLFMVISGYAISINILRLRKSPNHFLLQMSSAVTRRMFRIYLPVLVIAAISQVLFFFNLYHWGFGEGVLRGLQPWTSPWSHFTYLVTYMMDNVNIIAFQYNEGLNSQLWTMPVEFRGSCVVYLVIAGLSTWRSNLRSWALVIMSLYFLWYGMWDIFGFTAGLYLAEIEISGAADAEDEDNIELPLYSAEKWRNWLRSTRRFSSLYCRTGIALVFITGIYLLCLGDDGQLPPGYQSLAALQPPYWINWDIIHFSWKAVGAILTVFAIQKSPYLQHPLNTRPIQYLGKISFSLYLVHQTMYHLWRDPVKNFIWRTVNGNPYPGGEEGSQDPWSFIATWLGSGLILGPVTIYVADLYTRFVDQRCVAFTKRIEKALK